MKTGFCALFLYEYVVSLLHKHLSAINDIDAFLGRLESLAVKVENEGLTRRG